MNTIQLKVNEVQLIKHLKHAFSASGTFVSELLQNARRAGATRIDIRHDLVNGKHTLTIIDDGQGIDNPQNILCVGESGWQDDQVLDEENPFGMGFLSALYQAEHVRIESHGNVMEFDTDQALGFAPVEISTGDTWNTTITLTGIPDLDYAQHVKELVKGFPVPVYFNDEECERPDAIDSDRKWIDTDVGRLYLHQFDPVRNIEDVHKFTGTDRTHLYLQGLPIHSREIHTHAWYSGNILHLDSKRFMGRMPDRDMLVDDVEAGQVITATIKEIWRSYLTDAIKKADPEKVAQHWYGILRQWGSLDLLDQIDYIPTDVTMRYADTPYIAADWEDDIVTVDSPINRQKLESGEVQLIRADDLPYSSDDSWHLAMYIEAKNLPMLRGHLLSTHWAHRLAKDLSEDQLTVRIRGLSHESVYNGSWVYGYEVWFCEEIRIDGPCGSVEIDDGFLVQNAELTVGDEDRFCEGPVILIPEKCKTGQVVRQISMFEDEGERFDQEAMEKERERFERFLISERPGNPETLMNDLLGDLDLQKYRMLQGKVFRVEIDARGYRVAHVDDSMCLRDRAPLGFWKLSQNEVEAWHWDPHAGAFWKETFEECDSLEKRVAKMLHRYLRIVDYDDALIERFIQEHQEHLNTEHQVFTEWEINRWVDAAAGYPVTQGLEPMTRHHVEAVENAEDRKLLEQKIK